MLYVIFSRNSAQILSYEKKFSDRNSKTQDFEYVLYPRDKQANFATVTERARNGTLQDVFWAKDFNPFNIKTMIVVTNFELLEKLFRRPEVSDRISTKK